MMPVSSSEYFFQSLILEKRHRNLVGLVVNGIKRVRTLMACPARLTQPRACLFQYNLSEEWATTMAPTFLTPCGVKNVSKKTQVSLSFFCSLSKLLFHQESLLPRILMTIHVA
jgi:hypothetical protein